MHFLARNVDSVDSEDIILAKPFSLTMWEMLTTLLTCYLALLITSNYERKLRDTDSVTVAMIIVHRSKIIFNSLEETLEIGIFHM